MSKQTNKKLEIGLSNGVNSSFPWKQKADQCGLSSGPHTSCFTAACTLLGFDPSVKGKQQSIYLFLSASVNFSIIIILIITLSHCSVTIFAEFKKRDIVLIANYSFKYYSHKNASTKS